MIEMIYIGILSAAVGVMAGYLIALIDKNKWEK